MALVGAQRSFGLPEGGKGKGAKLPGMAEQVEVHLQGADSIYVSVDDGDKIAAAMAAREPTVEVRWLGGGSVTVLNVANIVSVERHPGAK